MPGRPPTAPKTREGGERERERERERGKRNNGDIIAFDGKKGRNESERERENEWGINALHVTATGWRFFLPLKVET